MIASNRKYAKIICFCAGHLIFSSLHKFIKKKKNWTTEENSFDFYFQLFGAVIYRVQMVVRSMHMLK